MRWCLLWLCLLSACGGATPYRVLTPQGWVERDVSVVDGRLIVAPASGSATAWLVPGFIDAHVHLGLADPEKVWHGGTTTVRDLGWDPSAMARLRRRLTCPQLLIAGPILCAPGGYPNRAGWCPDSTALSLATPEEAQRAVQSLDTDVVKIALAGSGPTLALPVLQAIVKTAHARHLQVTAHVSRLPELEKALTAGVDELAHFMFDDSTVSDALLDRMVAAGMRVCPTLHIRPSAARLDNLRRFVKRGGRVIYGTDLGNYGPPPGIDVRELELMQEAGMTPLQIVASATWESAAALGLHDRGSLVTGQRADFLVLDADPLLDLQVLGRPRQVCCGGEMFTPDRQTAPP